MTKAYSWLAAPIFGACFVFCSIPSRADSDGVYDLTIEVAQQSCGGRAVGHKEEGKIEITTDKSGQKWAAISSAMVASPNLRAFPNSGQISGLTAVSPGEFRWGAPRIFLKMTPTGPDSYDVTYSWLSLMKREKNEDKLEACETQYVGKAKLKNKV